MYILLLILKQLFFFGSAESLGLVTRAARTTFTEMEDLFLGILYLQILAKYDVTYCTELILQSAR